MRVENVMLDLYQSEGGYNTVPTLVTLTGNSSSWLFGDISASSHSLIRASASTVSVGGCFIVDRNRYGKKQ